MTQDTNNTSCQITCWIVAAMVGVAIAAMLMLLGDWRFIQAAFAGFLALVILGALLGKFICTSSTAKADLEAVRNGSKGAAATGVAAAAATAAAGAAVASKAVGGSAEATSSVASSSAASSGASSSADAASTASTRAAANTMPSSFAMQPSAALAGEDELAGRKGEWKYDGSADAAPSAKKTAAKKPAAKTPAADKAPAKDKAAAPAKAKRAPVAADGKPETLTQARTSGADDLKLISGVGPKLEGTLNELGFWHFDQVAAWRKKEVEWVDSRLKFKGRIERDDWISQAKILAKGGETEFSQRKKK